MNLFCSCGEPPAEESDAPPRMDFMQGHATSTPRVPRALVYVDREEAPDKEVTFTFGSQTEWVYDQDHDSEWCGSAGVAHEAEILRKFAEGHSVSGVQIRCQSRDSRGSGGQSQASELDHSPSSLVVFDFDETLTLATFLPPDPRCGTEIGWEPTGGVGEWNTADFVRYNFETPWVPGSRVSRLRKLLCDIQTRDRVGPGDAGLRRTLAVLSGNEAGAVAVLNLLLLTGLASFFSVIWPMPRRDAGPPLPGVYFQDGSWRTFTPPSVDAQGRKADILEHVSKYPAEWFPQLRSAAGFGGRGEQLLRLKPDNIALVDDDGANFGSESKHANGPRVLRCCKVARYDRPYRDCGVLEQMGGLGAHTEEDYPALLAFLDRPWDYPFDMEERPCERKVPPEKARVGGA